MAVSKVVLGDETLIDLTGDSVSSENLLQGATAHAANGEQITGGVVVTPMYTGTKSAIEEAIALGQIPEDAVVNITDDEETSSFQTQIDEINNSLPKFKHGTCTIVVDTNNYKDGEVIFDSPFEKVPLLLGNIINPSCTPHLEVTGVNFYSITQNGFKYRIMNAYRTALTITINWIAMEF